MARLNYLSRGFLVDCLRRTAFIAVLTTALLHGATAATDEGVSFFYFSGAMFSAALIVTLALAVWEIFTRERPWRGALWLLAHAAVIGVMIPFYATLMAGLTGATRWGETLALMAGLNTFFLVALLRASGEQLYDRLQRTASPPH